MRRYITKRRVITAIILSGVAWVCSFAIMMILLELASGSGKVWGMDGNAPGILGLIASLLILLFISFVGLGRVETLRFKLVFAFFAPAIIISIYSVIHLFVVLALRALGIL